MGKTAIEYILYETYLGTDGNSHRSRKANTYQEWVIQHKNATSYTIKFENNFSKKHLFTASKDVIEVCNQARQLWDASSAMTRAYWLAWGYWFSYPPPFLDQARRNADEAKLQRQALHRTPGEQLICATCNHEERRHKTGSGAACLCKEGGTASPCNCSPFVAKRPYQEKRARQGKPTTNPLQGATTKVTTYILMDKIPQETFEEVVVDAIVKESSAGWLSGVSKDLDWDFGARLSGCVVKVDTTQPASSWVELRGVKVGVRNDTTDPARPLYVVYHLSG